jgi:hypothetical protein
MVGSMLISRQGELIKVVNVAHQTTGGEILGSITTEASPLLQTPSAISDKAYLKLLLVNEKTPLPVPM